MKRIFCLFLCLHVLVSAVSCAFEQDNQLRVDVLNVGKADCIVLRIQGKTLMIDTGEEENYPEIASFLESEKIRTIDCLILSHFDKDHIGSAALILDNFSVKEVVETTFSSNRLEYDLYHSKIISKNVSLKQITDPLSFSFGDCLFKVLPPKKTIYERKQDNNASLIVEVSYFKHRLAFFGDAMEERISEYVADNKTDFDFVKLPYHGNFLDDYSEFLDNIKPEFATICCSAKNPADSRTLELLEEKEITTYLTQNGHISVLCDEDEIEIKQ